ncbi:TetR/AcrR family transcriptional regulator [Promicromonospora sp. Populi]|uniref:TetR/AcrR family transcriptional regulator n=1 Tax=Promicromonospora sp. Populi TaxID=3239420 RepID=UPI0034E27502
MPRLADHDQRRAQITDAARRVIAGDGLGAATFQSVAAEAGISVRLVQYYFGTKRQFLQATHQAVVAGAGSRFTRSLSALGNDPAPREVIRAILAELLPADAARRQDAIVLNAFHTAALTTPDDGQEGVGTADIGAKDVSAENIGAEDTLGAPRFLVTTIAEQLRRTRAGAAPAARRAADLDAELIVASAAGLTQLLLVDIRAAGRADQLLDRLLDRMVEG